MKIKVNVNVTGPLQSGTYILIYDPRQTNEADLIHAMISVDENNDRPDCEFILIPTYDVNSIRFLKVEEPVIIKGE